MSSKDRLFGHYVRYSKLALSTGPRTTDASGSRLDVIDGLRALAMLMVFTFHMWQFGGSPRLAISIGDWIIAPGDAIGQFSAGVDLFIVLSGFCLFLPVCRKPQTWEWRDYAWRRMRRIVPPYYAAIAYMTLLPFAPVLLYRLVGKPVNWPGFPSAFDYVTHFLFIHTLFNRTFFGIQGAFWSLGLEAQFYLVFPLVVWGFRRHGIRIALYLVLLSLAYRILIAAFWQGTDQTSFVLLNVTFLGRWMQFATGMASAWFVHRLAMKSIRLSAGAGTAGMLIACAMYILALIDPLRDFRGFPIRDCSLAIAYGIAIVSVCSSETTLRRLFDNTIMVWLGFISYSIFLLHQNSAHYIGEFLMKIYPFSGPYRFLLLITVGFGLVVILSYLFHRAFELPFMGTRRPIPPHSRPTIDSSSNLMPSAAYSVPAVSSVTNNE